MSLRWNRNSILGCSDEKTVMLDFDHTTLEYVKYWALRTMKKFRLGGFMVLESSESCYHVVFDRPVSWSENVKIMGCAVLMSCYRNLGRWFLLQCIKGWPTLRASPKGSKPSPRIVYREGRQDGQILGFLNYRGIIRNIMMKLG